ncbi:hypothetical protein L209DRAFT_48092 [Thermothelomyces heterothallicus CBS 203.75]
MRRAGYSSVLLVTDSVVAPVTHFPALACDNATQRHATPAGCDGGPIMARPLRTPLGSLSLLSRKEQGSSGDGPPTLGTHHTLARSLALCMHCLMRSNNKIIFLTHPANPSSGSYSTYFMPLVAISPRVPHSAQANPEKLDNLSPSKPVL